MPKGVEPTFGLVIRNSIVQKYVVMLIADLPSWTHSSGAAVHSMRAMVVDSGGVGADTTGSVVTISGGIGTNYGDWWVVDDE